MTKVNNILEKLTEEVSMHMLNMTIAPELTKDLILNAEKRAEQAIKQHYLDKLPKNPYSKRAIERMDEEMPKGKYLNLVNKGYGYNQAIEDLRKAINE